MNKEILPFLLDFQLNGIWGFKVFPYNILYFFGVCCDVSLFIYDSVDLFVVSWAKGLSLFLPS